MERCLVFETQNLELILSRMKQVFNKSKTTSLNNTAGTFANTGIFRVTN